MVVNLFYIFKSVMCKNMKVTEFKENLVRELFKKDININT